MERLWNGIDLGLLKCYNSIKTTENKQHCQRFVWRWSDSEPWKVYGIYAKHFRDKCAAISFDVFKKRVAVKHIDEAAIKMI